MDNIEFRALAIPASIHSTDAEDFMTMVDIRNAIYREINGNDDETMTAAELLPYLQPDPDEIHLVWLIVADGQPVGRLGIDIPLEDGSRTAYWIIEILRSHWSLGIGTAALRIVEQTAREHGRSLVQSWAQHGEPSAQEDETASDRLVSPTGFGTIPRDHIARFYLRHGYTLGQIERKSALALNGSLSLVEQLLATAQPVGYSLVRWMVPTPPEHRDGYAWMKSRMSTDVPAGSMEFDEETWDAERVTRSDRRWLDGGHTVLVTAARHDATGDLVAFTELAIGEDVTGPTNQIDTLVVNEHRGHRLGQWIKCANLLAWQEIAPRSQKVLTYNAEENRHMLNVNEAMGFQPVAYIGAWKKVLDI